MSLFMFRLSGAVCALMALLYAAPAASFSIRLNCDLRSLQLTTQQKVRLQSLRQHFRVESERVARQVRNQRGPVSLHLFFEKAIFDEAHAQRVAHERYVDEMAQTVEELRFYHEMYQMLTPAQRRIWANLCMRY